MPSSSSSSSSHPSSSSSVKSKRRSVPSSSLVSSFSFQPSSRWTREQLLKSLQMLNDLAAPLPPTLPPSPPASRAASPAPGSKRKLDSSSDPDTLKRPRASPVSDRQQQHQHSHHSHHQPPSLLPPQSLQPPQQLPSISNRQAAPSLPLASRTEPCEDGEVREEPVAVPPAPRGCAYDVPIRRPKKGHPSLRHFDALHDKYHNAGRKLKYSGDARFWSTYPPTHKEYRPIPDPPSPSSSYHKHGGLIARLELLDALVCFTYSIWSRDYGRRSCNTETWRTIRGFLGWCKTKWQVEEAANDAERALLGLIWMIEAFIHGRKVVYPVRAHLALDVEKIMASTKVKTFAAAYAAEGGLSGANATAPPMLPSPNSANSTPVNRDDGTPNTANGRPAVPVNYPPGRPPQYAGPVYYKFVPDPILHGPQPIPTHIMTAMSNVVEPINAAMVYNFKAVTSGTAGAADCIRDSQTTLNLPIMRRCFPKTWARMMYSTLLPTEEHEPDFEDEDGELYWPDQAASGEGLGWVCLMGKAMIQEYGKAYGYKGLDGVVPKPKPEGTTGNNNGNQSQQAGPPPGHAPPIQRPPASLSAPR